MRTDTGFALIDNYKKSLAENYDQETKLCEEVPESHVWTSSDFLKPVIKVEESHQQDFCCLADALADNCQYESDMMIRHPHPFTDYNNKQSLHIPSLEPISSDNNDILQTPIPTSEVLSTETGMPIQTSLPNSVSSQLLNVIHQPISSSVSFLSQSPTYKAATNVKARTFVTELAGSGGTVISNPSNYQCNTNADFLEDFSRENLEYTDLDRPVTYNSKRAFQTQPSNDGELEKLILEIIQQDSSNLNIPFDPLSWTCEHVRRWVSKTCQNHQLIDVSKEMSAINGQILCSWTLDYFSQFGDSGTHLFNELELLKAANSCQRPPSMPSTESIQSSAPMSSMPNFFAADTSYSFPLSPAASPPLSTCGSTSSDSNCALSQNVDMAEEENFLYPDMKTSPPKCESMPESKLFKRVPGRGHKKSIALWQFLRELLLSEQNYGCIRWIDRKAGIFKIEDSRKVANLWGAKKNRPAMNYDKLSRSVRQYYKKGIIKKPVQSKRLLYQFCPEYL